jgi:hypothetical protein
LVSLQSAPKKTPLEKQTDRIEELAAKISVPRTALTALPQVAELASEHRVATTVFADPDPFQEFQYPNAMAAKRAIAHYLGMPLAKSSAEQIAEVNMIVGTTLDKKSVLDQVRQYFRRRTGEDRDAE